MKSPTHNCPGEGIWRSWLDREGSEGWTAADLRLHLKGCSICQTTVDELRANAHFVDAAFAALEDQPAVAPLQFPTAAMPAPPPRVLVGQVNTAISNVSVQERKDQRVMNVLNLRQHARFWLASAAAVLICAAVAFTPQGQSAAAGFLAQFRSTKLQAVPVSSASLASINRSLASFEKLGTVSGSNGNRLPDVKSLKVASIAEANQRLPFAVKTPDVKLLPAGVPTMPQVSVAPAAEYRFKFDAARANQYFATIGRTDLSLPKALDGTTLVVNTPAAVLLEYGVSSNAGEKSAPGAASAASSGALIVGESGDLTVGTEGGATLDQVRSFLLTIPNLPPEAAAILNNADWSSTLPIPVPMDKVQWTSTTVAGQPGLLLNDNTGLGSAVIWHVGAQGSGQILGLAGTLKATDLAGIAGSLR